MPLIVLFFSLFLLFFQNVYSNDEYFRTLRNNKVNLRQGPSFDYPIKIFYKKKFLPVLIQERSDNFRKIRDHENNTGWVHISQLSKKKAAIVIDDNFDFKSIKNLDSISCIFVDEAQFLKEKHIKELSKIVDVKNINVMCYGIRTDFKGRLFPGSKALLALADNIIEIKTVCRYCDKKATMVRRIDALGNVIKTGSQILIGGNDLYESVCRKHFFNN